MGVSGSAGSFAGDGTIAGLACGSVASLGGGATRVPPITPRMEGISCMGGVPGLINDFVEIFGAVESETSLVSSALTGSVPSPGFLALLRLPRLFKDVIGVYLHQAQLHR